MMEHVTIGGRVCHVRQKGTSGPVVFWGMFPFQEGESEHTCEEILIQTGNQDFLLVAYQAEDWNRDFSPWEAPAAVPGETFAGKGQKMLEWLLDSGIPYVEKKYPAKGPYLLAGYSLAGLFSLWALYQTDAFEGAACCSGSLWYPGWEEYAGQNHILRDNALVYLSLGGKEEKTRNPMISTVGDVTRKQEKLLKSDGKVKACVLEWNSGGHFADSGKRLAKGIAWLLEHAQE